MLRDTINKAYKEFSKYTASLPLDVCTVCCMTTQEATTLANLSVDSIPRDLLSTYNDSARSEKTKIEEVKHFLPRYLELIADFNFPSHSAEISFSRLVPFDKNEWTKTELEILSDFQVAYFKHALQTYPIPSSGDQIDSIIIMFWSGGLGIDQLLKAWEETESLESVIHFKDLYLGGFNQHKRSKLSNSFGDNELGEKLTAWLQSTNVNIAFQERIERIVLHNTKLDEQTIYELNLLYELLRSEKKNII